MMVANQYRYVLLKFLVPEINVRDIAASYGKKIVLRSISNFD